MTKLFTFCIVLIFCISSSTSAQLTTRCTNWTKLDGSGNLGNKNPKPAFKVPDVRVKKCLTVNKKTGKVKQTCKFENTGSSSVKFLFCNMIELNSTHPTVTLTNTCNLAFDATTMKWKCIGGTASPSGQNGYHFGCEVVQLSAAGTAGANSTSSKTGTNPAFVGKEAKDFEVSYADIFDLSIANTTGADCGFNSGSCTNCFGADKGTNYGAGSGRASATGYWIMSDVPITDPFVRWQDLSGILYPVEYNPLANALAVPSQFPLTLPDLGRTQAGVTPPNQYQVDLLLWDIFVMTPDFYDSLPVQTMVVADNMPPGVFIEANPGQTTLVGGTMDFGQIFIGQPGMGLVPEGERINFCIAVVDPLFPDSIMFWSQSGQAIQDTEPPLVMNHNVSYIGGGQIQVDIDAEDMVALPIAANFWYSLDNGATWDVEPLEPAIDPIEEVQTNTFSAVVPTTAVSGDRIDYFFNVQDGVLNHTWFGPGNDIIDGIDNFPEATPVVLFPNPTAGIATIQFESSKTEAVLINVYDHLGKQVMTAFEKIAQTGHSQTVKLDMSHLVEGLYFYTVSYNGKHHVGKVSIKH